MQNRIFGRSEVKGSAEAQAAAAAPMKARREVVKGKARAHCGAVGVVVQRRKAR